MDIPQKTFIRLDLTGFGLHSQITPLDEVLYSHVYGKDWTENPDALRAFAEHQERLAVQMARSAEED